MNYPCLLSPTNHSGQREGGMEGGGGMGEGIQYKYIGEWDKGTWRRREWGSGENKWSKGDGEWQG